jgi:3-oxoacyl-[acyl-carrier-protein] synthase-3
MKKYKVTIKGSSSYLPSTVITNHDISERIDTTDEWIHSKLGIKERRIALNESVSDMGYKVAIDAIVDAKIDKEELDMIIVATSSPEKISPSIACTIHEKLQIEKNIPAFDINAVCSGFVYALTIASSMIESGTCTNILLIATEAYSKNTNWDDQHSVFFGDGAGAVVVTKSEKGWLYSELQANGKGTGMTGFQQPLNAPFIMKGKEVWQQAVTVLPKSIIDVLTNTNTNIEDISMLVPHQPSINILKIIANEVGLPMHKVKTVMDKYANIAGASIPIALDEALKHKEIVLGDKILLTAIGSGWTWGTILINYES